MFDLRRFLPQRPGHRCSVLLVCTANLCRSPMAEAMLRHRLAEMGMERQVRVASAGIRALVGWPMDPRALSVLTAREIPTTRHRARQLRSADFEQHDLVLGMEAAHRGQLSERSPEGCRARIGLVTDFVSESEVGDIPDPYYGNQAGFERVADLLAPAVDALAREMADRISALERDSS